MRLLLILAGLSLGRSFNVQELVREFEPVERIERGNEKTPEAKLPLPQLLNRYLKSTVKFKTPRGNVVYVSGGRSDGTFYLALAPEKGKVVLLDAMATLFAKQNVEIDGEKIQIDVDLNVFKQRKSKVQVRGGAGYDTLLGEAVVDEIVSAAYNAGADLTIGGKPFKFTHGNKVVRSGGKLVFGASKFVGFLHKDGDKISGFTAEYSDLLKGPVTLDVEADTLKLKLDGETLVVSSAS